MRFVTFSRSPMATWQRRSFTYSARHSAEAEPTLSSIAARGRSRDSQSSPTRLSRASPIVQIAMPTLSTAPHSRPISGMRNSTPPAAGMESAPRAGPRAGLQEALTFRERLLVDFGHGGSGAVPALLVPLETENLIRVDLEGNLGDEDGVRGEDRPNHFLRERTPSPVRRRCSG